jgi:signal transduction histidine kinase
MVITILREDDIAAARNAVRETGFALGFPVSALSAAQAIISEMCLYAINSGSTADLTVYALNRAGRAGISMVMQTVEVTEKELQDDRLTPGLGLPGAKRLSDHWEVSVRRGRTTVHAIKWRPVSTHAELASQYLQMVETAPHKAWEFGRQAVLDGLGITAMAVLHSEAMKHVSAPPQAQLCFEEALMAFEMVYLGFGEARASMSGIHDLLEQETERIAQSLHDEAAQTMAALSLGVDDLQCEQEACAAQAGRLRALVEESDKLFRSLSHELRPPLLEDEGLASALHHLCESFSSRRGIRVEFRNDLQRRLTSSIDLAFYRTVQIALANVVRHARASNVVIRTFAAGASVLCAVRDDGCGIDPKQLRSAGLGFRGIRERAAALGGTIELDSVLPHGLEIRIRLPDPAANLTSFLQPKKDGSAPRKPSGADIQ